MTAKNILLIVIISVLILLIYASTFKWLYERYAAAESYYSHGFLVPLVTVFLIWLKRGKLKGINWNGNSLGLIIIILSLIIHSLSLSMSVFFVSGFSLLSLIFGISLFLFGKAITKNIWFPLFFLIFMFPVPLIVINAVSFPMIKLVTTSSLFILRLFTRIPIYNEGFQLIFPKGIVVVEKPCSGLRSLIVMLALTSIFAYLLKGRQVKRFLLLILAIPIAFISNLIRVVVLCIALLIFGSQKVMGFFHNFTGYMIFVIEFSFMWLLWNRLSNE